MIVDRITAVRVIPPRVTRIPVPQASQLVEAVYPIGSGERHLAVGTTGYVLDVSYEELEIDTYAPRDLMTCIEQVRPR